MLMKDQITLHEWGKIFVRGIGQVMFQDNALTGLLFLVGIAAAGFEESPSFALLMAVGGLVGTIVGTLTAKLLGYDEKDIRDGIYGFNGTLVGIAHALLLQAHRAGRGPDLDRLRGFHASSPGRCGRFLPFPTYTFPFIVTTWVFMGIATLMDQPRVELPPPPNSST